MKVAVGLRRVAAGKRTSGRRAAQIAFYYSIPPYYFGIEKETRKARRGIIQTDCWPERAAIPYGCDKIQNALLILVLQKILQELR